MDALEARQLWATPTEAPAATSAVGLKQSCQALNLPAGGTLILPNGDIITLATAAAFKPACTPTAGPAIIAGTGPGTGTPADFHGDRLGDAGVSIDEGDSGPQFSDFRDPFYASTFPQCYALAATTIIAYTLVIMLFITPRSFFHGGVVVLGRRGFTHGGAGGHSIGGRPWLQKAAALTVAISLTIASANTFKVAEEQYSFGYQNAQRLQEEVMGSTELKVIRLISDTFLWLAQAQTLIRLFPRQREKVIIKWTAFGLITFDLIFDSLNSFLYTSGGAVRPRSFSDAVPALSYLFQLSLGVLYAAWVIYYALMKKKYAFYHPQMRNMCLVAVLSLLALLVPVVFFILDICQPDFIGWGDYARWVGAAAASVIVWEWVERIEALEREEKKDGILGREVFDGDEMLEMTSEFSWPKKRNGCTDNDGGDDDGGESGGSPMQNQNSTSTGRRALWPSMSSLAHRYRPRPRNSENPAASTRPAQPNTTDRSATRSLQPPLWPARPQPAVTPVSRTDTASADSTIYAIRYHPLTESTSQTDHGTPSPAPGEYRNMMRRDSVTTSRYTETVPSAASPDPNVTSETSARRWRALAQAMPFRRTSDESNTARPQAQPEESKKRDLRSRLEDFAMSQADKIREKINPTINTDSLPVMVIPAPARRGAALAQLLEEEESQQQMSRATTHQADVSAAGHPAAEPSSPTNVRRDSSASVGSMARPSPMNPSMQTGSPVLLTAAQAREGNRDARPPGPSVTGAPGS
ncbi:uncharacterized protein E0L32_008209 [Thyridium curvatum]|uniref:Uncharacterized protein n=1 Tax=Thyridium curvatum TaxID=1093900 RepID=A0A507B2N8_9PEZI|nr:uncharacterized protein E0L32_008209 [Thyridium curvatum]TPX10820.1 hypothetical protein E0L32_008209 [Thyridium curvatum]